MSPRTADRLALQAASLVSMVRDDDPENVGQYLAALNPTRVVHLTIALAAMVPDDKPLSELLAWCDPNHKKRQEARELKALRQNNVRELLPHGTHSAFNRHKNAGEEPCAKCREGERTYQRERARRRRASA